ncbi:MAG: tetratricopeptide repeat protein [Geothrix sp.]|nr:tetratricopeptide repeat protein [Geothrix sp.]
MTGALHWAHPWAGLLALGFLLLQLWRGMQARRRTAQADLYADDLLRPWTVIALPRQHKLARRIAEALIWILLAASLAGPRVRLEPSPQGMMATRHDVNIMVVLDTSPNMALGNTDDDTPLMLQARSALLDLQGKLRGERLGLAVYGQTSGEILPPTNDPALFDAFLDQTTPGPPADAGNDTASGAGLAGALWLARQTLLQTPGKTDAILLLADASPATGEDAGDLQNLRLEATKLQAAGIPVFVLALRQASWLGGRPSALDIAALQDLARQTGGKLADEDGAWHALYQNGIADLPSNAPPPGTLTLWRDLFAWPLCPALLLMAILAWPQRKNRALALLILLFFMIGHAPAARADNPAGQQRAWQRWQAQDYRQAASLYARLPGWSSRMGEGDSLYRLGDYPAALAAFQAAMLDADTDTQRAAALFNLGNAAFHQPGLLAEAIDAYQASQTLRPNDPANLHNLALAQHQRALNQPSPAVGSGSGPGLNDGGSGFTQTGDHPPSRLARPIKKLVIPPAQTQILSGPGALALRPGANQTNTPQNLPPQDIAAAARKIQLLQDQHAQLEANLLHADNQNATNGVAADR